MNSTRIYALCLSFCLYTFLSGCESMVTHQYSVQPESHLLDASTLKLAPSLDPNSNSNNVEELQEEPLVPIHSSGNKPMLTPASYYHSPDPPTKLPEYVPSLFFDFDSWILTNKGKHILELTASQLTNDPESNLIIEGHCDDRGSEGYNLVLGDKRAQAMQNYLVSLGIAKSRLTAVSFGDTHPVCFENNESCHALNRRGYLVKLKADRQ